MTHAAAAPGAPAAAAPGALAGRKALVVGVETAAGGAIASALGAAGADVALAVLRPDEGVLAARRIQRELRALGRAAYTYALDATLGQNAKVTTRQVAKELGGLDLVVSAADAPLAGPLARTSEAQLGQAMALNCHAHAWVARAAFDEFRRGGRGCLLIVTHMLGERPAPGAGAYALACAAAIGLGRALAAEHAAPGLAAVTLLRGAAAFDPSSVAADGGGLEAAIASADAAEAPALARLAAAAAASTPEAVTGRVLSAAADAP